MKWIGCVSLLLLVVGCSQAPYVEGYYFSPHPALAEIPATQPSQPPPLAAYATIVGIRRPDDKQQIPFSVEVRLRLDNNGPYPVSFDPRSLDLQTGDLLEFLPVVITNPAPFTLPPGDSAVITGDFPFPDGLSYDRVNLGTLILHWYLQIGPQPIKQNVQFQEEIRPSYYDPYWYPYPVYAYPPYPVFGGVVVIHGGWHGGWRR